MEQDEIGQVCSKNPCSGGGMAETLAFLHTIARIKEEGHSFGGWGEGAASGWLFKSLSLWQISDYSCGASKKGMGEFKRSN